MTAMKRTPTSDGQQKWGEKYRSWDYFVAKHAVAVLDPRGDQGHFGPCFMTLHRMFLIELEEALLSVLRANGATLDALPYWDQYLDTDTGELFGTEEYIFSAGWFGGYVGNESEGWVVTDGRLPRWPVSRFDAAFFPQNLRARAAQVYNGSTATGLLRGPGNPLATRATTRLPKRTFPGGPAEDTGLTFTAADYRLCADARWVHNWMEWQACIENAAVAGRRTDGKFWNEASGLHWMHSQFHLKIGGYAGELPPDFPATGGLSLTMGDMMDVSTSPNDPLFPFHHANIDRWNLLWMDHAAERNASLAEPGVLWGYPADYDQWQREWATGHVTLPASRAWASARDGCLLDDVASAVFPFDGLWGPGPHTHRDALTQPLPYVYDTLS